MGLRGLALVAVLLAIVAGCSTSSDSSGGAAAVTQPVGSHPPRKAPPREHPLTRATGLAYGSASPDQVQQQAGRGWCHYRGSGLFIEPDPSCTPGAADPAVTQANIQQTICRPGGYTESVRPPESVTEPEKEASMAGYDNSADPSTLEYDHLVPLEIGGAVNDPRNLWPEPNYPGVSADSYVLNPKDRLEDRLHDLVCSGDMPLGDAQRAIARDWVGAYQRFVGSG